MLEIKKQHKSITDKIQFNVNELNKLKIAQSSMFAIPSPNVPTLPHGVGLNTQVTQTANSNIVKGVEKTLGNIRDGLAEMFDCSFGMSYSNDLDKAAKNPNVGTELSDSDRIALGGTGSGSPDGWEPDNNLSTSDRRSIQSLRGQVRLHKEKLAAYRRNPDAFDNQGHLKNAPNNTVRQRIIDGRIKHLEKEIKTFEKNINEIKNGKG